MEQISAKEETCDPVKCQLPEIIELRHNNWKPSKGTEVEDKMEMFDHKHHVIKKSTTNGKLVRDLNSKKWRVEKALISVAENQKKLEGNERILRRTISDVVDAQVKTLLSRKQQLIQQVEAATAHQLCALRTQQAELMYSKGALTVAHGVAKENLAHDAVLYIEDLDTVCNVRALQLITVALDDSSLNNTATNFGQVRLPDDITRLTSFVIPDSVDYEDEECQVSYKSVSQATSPDSPMTIRFSLPRTTMLQVGSSAVSKFPMHEQLVGEAELKVLQMVVASDVDNSVGNGCDSVVSDLNRSKLATLSLESDLLPKNLEDFVQMDASLRESGSEILEEFEIGTPDDFDFSDDVSDALSIQETSVCSSSIVVLSMPDHSLDSSQKEEDTFQVHDAEELIFSSHEDVVSYDDHVNPWLMTSVPSFAPMSVSASLMSSVTLQMSPTDTASWLSRPHNCPQLSSVFARTVCAHMSEIANSDSSIWLREISGGRCSKSLEENSKSALKQHPKSSINWSAGQSVSSFSPPSTGENLTHLQKVMTSPMESWIQRPAVPPQKCQISLDNLNSNFGLEEKNFQRSNPSDVEFWLNRSSVNCGSTSMVPSNYMTGKWQEAASNQDTHLSGSIFDFSFLDSVSSSNRKMTSSENLQFAAGNYGQPGAKGNVAGNTLGKMNASYAIQVPHNGTRQCGYRFVRPH